MFSSHVVNPHVPLSGAFHSFVIVNPAAAAGSAGRSWELIARALRSVLGDFQHAVTQARGDATLLTRSALRDGFEMVVAVGGDGTLNEVAGGFFEAGSGVQIAPQAVLGVVAVGTGCDFARSIGQTTLEAACACLAGRATRNIDVGLANYTDHNGCAASRIFINVASFGVSGVVARLVSPRLKAVSGQLAFTLATLRALAVHRDHSVKFEFDGLPARSMAITNCAIGNGRYFGAGMQVAPGAQLDDGEFDATIWSGFGVMDFIRLRGAIRDGSHVNEPGTKVLRTRRAIATCESTVLVEIDGESVGRLPARFEVLPAAIRLKV